MKRINSLLLLLIMSIGLTFNANALKVTLKWDIPGSVKIMLEKSKDGTLAELAPDQTSYTYEINKTYGYCYIFPSGIDYYLAEVTSSDGTSLRIDNGNNGPFCSVSLTSATDGLTYHIKCEKVERNQSFTFDLENGLGYISAKFNSGYTPTLTKGVNKIMFNPEIDNPLTLSLIDVPSAYLVSLDGVPVEKNQWYPTYNDITIPAGGVLKVRLWEDDIDSPMECTLKIDCQDGALTNIYNRTSGKFTTPDQLVDNSMKVLQNSEIRVNFNTDDFDITGLTLDGKDIFSSMSSGSVLFTVSEPEMVLKVESQPHQYPVVEFTGYIVNGEGVQLSTAYGSGDFDLPEGEALTADLKVGSLTLPAGQTHKYIIPIATKRPQFFFRPKDGYYLSDVLSEIDGKVEQHSSNSSMNAYYDGTTFYIVAEKMETPYKADLKIIGSEFMATMSSENLLSSVWGNPDTPSYSISEGEQSFEFIPGYGTPLKIAVYSDSESGMRPALFMDGGEVTGKTDTNSGAFVFTFTPWFPTQDLSKEDHPVSHLELYNSSSQRPVMSGASLQLEDGASAEFFYSELLHPADPAGQPVISGTLMTVRPASREASVTFKGAPVKLDENGEFTFKATGNARNNVVTVSGSSPVEPEKPDYIISPADGDTTDDLSKISITFPSASTVEYNDLPISLSGPEFNARSMDVSGIGNTKTVLFSNPAVEGDYTVTFPEGAFLLDGKPSAEYSAIFSFEIHWALNPPSGTVIEKFEGLTLSFPHAKDVEYTGHQYDFILRGQSFIAPGFDVEPVTGAECPTFRLSLLESSPEPPVGEYVFRIEEGTFTIDGKPSVEIKAEYTIDHESSVEYLKSPANGTIVYQDFGFDCALIFDETALLTRPDTSKIKVSFDNLEIPADAFSIGVEANMLMFSVFDKTYAKEGTFKINIEPSAFNIGRTPVPAIEETWAVIAPKTYSVVVTPSDESRKVNDLSKIYVCFPEAETGYVYQESGAQLRNKDYSYSQTGKLQLVSGENGVTFLISFDPAPKEAGEYTLFVNTGTFTLDTDMVSPEMNISYDFDPTYSAIGALISDGEGKMTVHTLDGRCLLNEAPASELLKLEEGIYLINGKKILLKSSDR